MKKDKAGPSNVSREKFKLLGELYLGDSFIVPSKSFSRQPRAFTSLIRNPSNVILGDPRPQVLGLYHWEPHSIWPRPQALCYNANLKNPWEISFKSKWELLNGPCWTHLINWLPQFPNQLPTPDPTPQQGDQTKMDPKLGPSSAPQGVRTTYQNNVSHRKEGPQVGGRFMQFRGTWRTQHLTVCRHIKCRFGRSLRTRTVVRSRKIIAHKRFRARAKNTWSFNVKIIHSLLPWTTRD